MKTLHEELRIVNKAERWALIFAIFVFVLSTVFMIYAGLTGY